MGTVAGADTAEVSVTLPQSVQSTVVTDDGIALHVETWPATRPDAPLVLCLHGITANRRGFLPLLEVLRGEVELVAYDARGRGLSDKPEDPARYGHRRHGEDAACVLRAIGRKADVVVGQSMGAWDGLQLAAHHPDLVGALVLGDGGFFPDLPDGTDPQTYVDGIMGQGWQARLRAVVPSRDLLFAALRNFPPLKDSWSDAVEGVFAAGIEELPDGSVRNLCSPVGAEFDATDYFTPLDAPYVRTDLKDVRCPVTLVRAPLGFAISPETMTPLITDDAVDGFRAALPQLRVITVEGTNHYSVNFGPAGMAAIAAVVRKEIA